ncbi:MAG: energy transducer TonB [Candidatus Sulfotelmatobacter sp.]
MGMRFAISTFLTCSILLFARVQQAQSPQQSPQQTPTELTKVCSEKVPPPCATPPRPIYSPPPEYSAEARSARYQGDCVLLVIVEADGRTSHIRVRSRLGMGLDEKAIEAVKHWKFAPALKDGKPVSVEIAIEVAFHL